MSISPRMSQCIKSGKSPCKGRGVMLEYQFSKFYGKEVSQAVPCYCRMQDMVEEWLDPFIRVQYPGWNKTAAKDLPSEEDLNNFLNVKENSVVVGTKEGVLLTALSALKAHLRRNGWQSRIPYLLTSEQQMDDYHFQGSRKAKNKESILTGVDWRELKLVIITLGMIHGSVLTTYLAPRLGSLVTAGIRVWILYHHDLHPSVQEGNSSWSQEMDQLTANWNWLELAGKLTYESVGPAWGDDDPPPPPTSSPSLPPKKRVPTQATKAGQSSPSDDDEDDDDEDDKYDNLRGNGCL